MCNRPLLTSPKEAIAFCSYRLIFSQAIYYSTNSYFPFTFNFCKRHNSCMLKIKSNCSVNICTTCTCVEILGIQFVYIYESFIDTHMHLQDLIPMIYMVNDTQYNCSILLTFLRINSQKCQQNTAIILCILYQDSQ